MRKNYPKNRKSILDTYDRVYVHMPEHEDIEKFVYPDRKVIYINIAAKPGAKIIKLANG